MSDPPSIALAALGPVVDVLEHLRIRYHVGGSLASSAYGMPRASADVDLIADLEPEQADVFVAQLEADYYVDRERVLEATRLRQSFNLIHLRTMMKVDVFIPEASEFARREQDRAQPVVLDAAAEGRRFFVKSPEDVVLRKLSWYRAGREVSERQWSDVLGVLKVGGERLDRRYLNRWASALGVSDLLERALSTADDL